MTAQSRMALQQVRNTFCKVTVVALLVLCGVGATDSFAQRIGAKAVTASDPILSAQIVINERGTKEPLIQPKALDLYRHAVGELHRKKYAAAEKDARRAVELDRNFADADALAATAALAQRHFDIACQEALDAVRLNADDEKAWVILATADNYLENYSGAAHALGHVLPQNQGTWQVAYQWARAEAGQDHPQQTLNWANRAALTAPSDFAPLHLLRASALLAHNSYPQAADELATYLELLGRKAPERAGLTRELARIKALPVGAPQSSASAPLAAASATPIIAAGAPEYNALAN